MVSILYTGRKIALKLWTFIKESPKRISGYPKLEEKNKNLEIENRRLKELTDFENAAQQACEVYYKNAMRKCREMESEIGS